MERRELYAYTFPSYLKDGDVECKVKVGDSEVGRWEERIQEQMGTATPEAPIKLLLGLLPEDVRDHKVHAQLIKNGLKRIIDGKGREWFVTGDKNDPFKAVRKAYNEITLGSSRTEHYTLRKEQNEAIKKASKWFKKEYAKEVIDSATYKNRFLINAKMRFGKCFTSIHLAKNINARNTLIVTYKPDVIGEWIDTVNEQVDFDGWTGIRAKSKPDRPNDPSLNANGDFPKSSGPIVLCVSLQDLSIDEDGTTKKRLEKIPEMSWDLVIFDEVHYGSRTERAKNILNQLKFSHRLDLSGTPFRLIEQDDFSSQQVYTYSYLDEMENKKEERESDPDEIKEKVYRLMPDLNISAIEITDEDIKEQRDTFETDDIDFSLNTLFKTNEESGTFIYEDAVDHFIDGLSKSDHSARPISVYGKLGSQLGCPPKRHTVWWMNRVESITTLIKKLEKHPYFSNFILVNASGSDNKKEEDYRIIAKEKSSVQKAITDANENPTKLGTITFTCGRFLTGVTIREWDSILILNDTKSAESYYQAIFRVQSAWVNEKTKEVLKPQAWIFDFAITRCLQVTYECANNIADQIDQKESSDGTTDIDKDNLEIVTQGLCDGLHITKRFYEGQLVSSPVTAKDIFQALNHEGAKIALARRITSNVLVNFGKLKLLEAHPNILEILKKVKGYRTQNVGEISAKTLVEIGGENGDLTDNPPKDEEKPKTEAEKEKEKKEKKKKDSHREWYSTQIKRLAICMADFIYMTYHREYKIDDVIETKSPEFFEIMTGISKDDFNLLCDLGLMNRFALNRIVREFRDQEETSVKPEEYILENLKKFAV